ncbi:MAG: radical SAM protein [Acidaminococcaceae bacterium]|nr:radical SAM protein [Acidaminococcaceae bacterium]MDD4721944.1 radical SAM protein [Acidaminococcaceae bacterium]
MASLINNLEKAMFSKVINRTLNCSKSAREKSLIGILNAAEKIAGPLFAGETYKAAKDLIVEPHGKWKEYVETLIREIDHNVLRTTALNLGFEAAYLSTQTVRANRKKYGFNIPWVILLDPTSACNMACKGCWAAKYGHGLNLSYEEIDKVITQAKELGIRFFIYTGGEPLLRKDDLIRLCKKHDDCYFLAFSNGTLVTEDFCRQMLEVGNFSLSLSLEGFEEINDSRRGKGAFRKTLAAMDLLKKFKLLFGSSVCYTKENLEMVTSDAFLDLLISKGCRYSWYFHYMPVGRDAVKTLLPTPQQRAYIYRRLREVRGSKGGKPIFAIDFQNDGEFMGGCIAGGRNYLHINANGDVEPCVFIHYSQANIKKDTLLDALQQPLFLAYRDNQPFNTNHLLPCPMLENPQKIKQMVKMTHAVSTDLQAPEDVNDLCEKCTEYADNWQPVANKLWGKKPHGVSYYNNYFKKKH